VVRRVGYRRGKTSEGAKPMSVTGMKQGRKGARAEKRVERLRKPEGAAQLELVAPVLVAARYLIRWRVTKPHGRVVDKRQVERVFGCERRSGVGR
jgi:hypothetical protein